MSDAPDIIDFNIIEKRPDWAKLVDAHAPGIYFGMPEDEYFADRSLSASGIKDMHASPLTFWIKSGFNPHRPDDSTEPKERGKAFHTRLLEGAGVFDQRYVTPPRIEDYPGALDGGAVLKARCKELALPVSGTIAELCARIRTKDPAAVFWSEIEAEFEQQAIATRRSIIKPKLADEINRQVRIIELHPGTEKALRGGYSEVSIFWVDPDSGVPMKARIDYQKARAIVEVKTFTNPFGKPIDAAIAGTVANNKYFVDAVVRSEAVERGKALYRKHGAEIVRGPAPPADWLAAFAEPGPHAFVFLFLEAGDVPNVRVREVRQREAAKGDENLYWMKGRQMFREAVRIYAQCLEHYGPDLPWVDPQPMRPFFDTDFPTWALD